MTNSVSRMYWNEKVQLSQPQSLTFLYPITAAKTISDPLRAPVLTAFDAISTQATIDNFLGTTNEFLVAAFDATAMGTDAFAMIINMGGQVAELYSSSVTVSTGTGGVTTTGSSVVTASTTLTASSLTNEAARGTNGNLALRAVITGLDALTSGIIRVTLNFRTK